jgi:hypothetical protein
MTHDPDNVACVDAERLIERAQSTSDLSQYEDLIRQAYEALRPLIESKVPCAQYLHACFTLSLETRDEAVQDRRHLS